MRAKEAINKILSKACPIAYSDESGIYSYVVELHCTILLVTARRNTNRYGTISYSVLNVETYKE